MTETRWCSGCMAEVPHELVPAADNGLGIELVCTECDLGVGLVAA